MSYLLPHLRTAWDVDRSIVLEEKRVVVIRFGRDEDATCMAMDDTLAGIAESIKNFAVIFLVNIGEVPDFNDMYELYDPCTVMFFFRNKHIMCARGRVGALFAGLLCCRSLLLPPPPPPPLPFFFPAQVRLWDGQQQQDNLDLRAPGHDRRHRDSLPRRTKGPRPCHQPKGLFDKIPLLSTVCAARRLQSRPVPTRLQPGLIKSQVYTRSSTPR